MNAMEQADREYKELIAKQDVNSLVSRYEEIVRSKYEIKGVVLYGSRARGDNRIESDIDLAIVFEKLPDDDFERRSLAMELYELAWDLQLESGLIISPLPVDEGELSVRRFRNASKDPKILSNIAIEGIGL